MIYLDYCADTPADPAVLARFCEAAALVGNANSAHSAGRAARAELERITARLAALLGVQPAELIYTSGATEANNLALKGLAQASVGRHIVTTPLEHSSTSASLAALERQGWEVSLAHVGPDGRLDLPHLRSLLRPDTTLVAVSAVDSELGAVQPLAELSALVHRLPGCRLHVDATQAIGKVAVDLCLADTASLAPHKFYGLNGCGLLYKRRGLPLEPQLHGGGSTTPYRSGTPALALAASIEPALRAALEQLPARTARVRALNDALRAAFARYPRVRINSPADAVPHILNVSVRDIKGTRFQRELDARGVCVSVKSACSSDGLPSRAVLAVTGDARRALESWRISLSHRTTDAELAGFLAAFDACYAALCPPQAEQELFRSDEKGVSPS